MKRLINEHTYKAVEEDDFSWTVIENETGLAYRVGGIPMVSLSEETAIALAEILNGFDIPQRITIH
jgi:hypothetical protein